MDENSFEQDACLSERSDLTYFQLSDRVFFWHAIALHTICIGFAMAVSKIDMIFDLTGAITGAFSIFLFPAIGYLVAFKRYGDLPGKRRTCETWLFLLAAWMFVFLGLLLIFGAIYINVLRATGRLEEYETETSKTK